MTVTYAFRADNRQFQGFSRTFAEVGEYFILSPSILGSKCVGTGKKKKTPDASGHMAAAPGVCCYLFVLVCEIEFLAVIVRIRHTFQLGKGLLGQRPHIPVHTRHGCGDLAYRSASVCVVYIQIKFSSSTVSASFLIPPIHFSWFWPPPFRLVACLLSASCLRIDGRGLRILTSRRSSLLIMAYTPCRSFMLVKHRDL